MKSINVALIGAGSRGMGVYGEFALRNPHRLRFVAVAEPDVQRRELFGKLHGISGKMQFNTWEGLLSQPELCDAIIIATQDRMHFGPVMAALDRGYDVLLEKPMSPNLAECIEMAEKAEKQHRLLMICHVLRYTPFFSTIKRVIDEGRIGNIVSVQHNENVAYWHQAHSFVRGNWNNSNDSSAMILAKSCHDMDILAWLIGEKCLRVSSFGSLKLFKRANAPEGSADRCIEGCPVESGCPFSALKLYLGKEGWPANVVSYDTDLESMFKALKEGPYGRCVYKCDNNVVDHQVVNMEFEGGATVAFTMCAFTADCTRTIKIMGTQGEIRGVMEKGEIEVTIFNTGVKEVIRTPVGESHSGGDEGLMNAFVDRMNNVGGEDAATSAQVSLQSHIMAFAAEKSRLEKRVVELEELMEGLA